MTEIEERQLKGFMGLSGERFEDWYKATRDGSPDGEIVFNEMLALAQAWARGYGEGWAACRSRLESALSEPGPDSPEVLNPAR